MCAAHASIVGLMEQFDRRTLDNPRGRTEAEEYPQETLKHTTYTTFTVIVYMHALLYVIVFFLSYNVNSDKVNDSDSLGMALLHYRGTSGEMKE